MMAWAIGGPKEMWKRLLALWTVVRGDAKSLFHALRHPEAPSWLKVGTALLLLYLLSPIDLVPDVIPVLGVVDDLIIIPAVIRWMLRKLPAHIRAHAQQRASGQPDVVDMR
jgi:uncharacterized membrane protein YkvA (DUF1232 family)